MVVLSSFEIRMGEWWCGSNMGTWHTVEGEGLQHRKVAEHNTGHVEKLVRIIVVDVHRVIKN